MAIFSDTFTDTAGTDLASHTPGTGTWALLYQSGAGEPDATINASNQLVFDSDVNDGVVYQCNGTYPSADYDIEITAVTLVNITTAPAFLFVRIQDIDNLYALRLGQPAVGDSRLYKKVAGVWTALGVAFTTPADGSVVKLEIIGTALKAYDDGVEVASATDSDISAAGTAGIGAGGGTELIVSGDDSRAHIFDNLTVTDLGGGGGTTTPQAVAGTLTSSSTLTLRSGKPLAGAVTSAGGLVLSARKVLAGTVTSAGALANRAAKVLAGTLTSSGALSAIKTALVSVGGTLTSAGTLTRQAGKAVAGTLTSGGTVTRAISKSLAGTLAAAGDVTKRLARALAGTLGLAGTATGEESGAVTGIVHLTLHARSQALTLETRTAALTLAARSTALTLEDL